MSDKSIYIFDSGVGGITLLHLALQKLPNEHFIYYADVLNAPYGIKSSGEVLDMVTGCIDSIDHTTVKALVLACNTATSIAVTALRQKYDFPIIGMEPAIKLASHIDTDKKIVLWATELTLKEQKLKSLSQQLNLSERLVIVPASPLVTAAEKFEFITPNIQRTINSIIASVNINEVAAIVLGCTHFLYFKPMLKKILPKAVRIIDGHHGTVNHLKTQINPTTSTSKQEIACILSGMDVDSEFLLPYLDYCDQYQINKYEAT